jgi:hypothetical protein
MLHSLRGRHKLTTAQLADLRRKLSTMSIAAVMDAIEAHTSSASRGVAAQPLKALQNWK